MLGPLQLEELPDIPVRVGSGLAGRSRICDLKVRSLALFQLSYSEISGLSDPGRTDDLLLPKQARYQLRYREKNVTWRKREDSNLRGLAANCFRGSPN